MAAAGDKVFIDHSGKKPHIFSAEIGDRRRR
jgi:hypothetical protein